MGASEAEGIVVASVVEEVVAEVSHLLLSLILEFGFLDPDWRI